MRVPRYDIPRVFRLKARLMSVLFFGNYYSTPEGSDFLDLVANLRQQLPSELKYDAVYETARQLAGVELTPIVCEQFCWRVAGNLHRLAAGHAVYPWTGQRADEWLPVQFLRGYQHYRKSSKTLGYNYDLRVLAGSAAPMRLRQFWSSAKQHVVSRLIGFSAPWGKRPFSDGAQMIGLRFVGKAIAAKSHEEPFVDELAFPSWCLSHNRDILQRRFKVIPCPAGYGDRPCHRCFKGFLDCPAATHRETYVERPCPKCNTDSFFNPESSSSVCVICTGSHVGK